MIDYQGLISMYRLVGVACIAVLIAIAWDLGSGLLKAKIRKEVRTSYAYDRTSLKLLCNEGLLVVCSFVDLFLYVGHAWTLLEVESLTNVPVITLAVAAWLCFVQAVSIKEKASSKSEKRAKQQLIAIMESLPNSQVIELLKALGKIKNEDNETET